jgi:CheY-like chemotaxis protein
LYGVYVKLLIVDDSKAMRLIVRRGLDKFEQENFSIKQANCGKDALAIIGDWQPDIILSDWHMPNMTGLELISIIKQRNLPIKVGIVTSEKKKNRLQQALDQGAEFILPKPFEVEELHNAVLPLIKHKKNKLVFLPEMSRLNQALNLSLSMTVTLSKVKNQQAHKDKLPCLLALFNDNKDKVRNVVMLDLQVACAFAAIKNNIAKAEIDHLLQEREINKTIISACENVLKDCHPAFIQNKKSTGVTLSKILLCTDNLKQVAAVFGKSDEERIDLSCKVGDFSLGYITIIGS